LNHDHSVQDQIPECESPSQARTGVGLGFVAQQSLLLASELLNIRSVYFCWKWALFQLHPKCLFNRFNTAVSAIFAPSATAKMIFRRISKPLGFLMPFFVLFFRTGRNIHSPYLFANFFLAFTATLSV
jgi:hypothetical protein